MPEPVTTTTQQGEGASATGNAAATTATTSTTTTQANQGQAQAKTYTEDEMNREKEISNQLKQQLEQSKRSQQPQQDPKKNPFDAYSEEDLTAMKYDSRYAEWAPRIENELRRRDREFVQKHSSRAIDQKISEISAMGLHKDFQDSGSKLSQRLNHILSTEAPYLRDQPNGAIIAAKMALGELGLSTSVMSETKIKEAEEEKQRQLKLKGSGANGTMSNGKDATNMDDAEFETFVNKTKQEGYQ